MTTDKIKARHLDEDFKLPLDKLEEMPTAESIGASPVGHTHTAEEIGLGSVDNTADASKPVSTAQATAIADAKKAGTDAQSTADGIRTDLTKLEGTVSGHVGNDDIHFTATERSKLAGIATGANKYSHPTYTAKNSGLYKVTVDGTGHVSGATVVTKSDITGLGIPAQDTTYSDATTSSSGLMSSSDKSKLDGIATGANKTTVDSSLSSTSTNPVQNKVINSALAGKLSTSLKGATNGLAELDANGKVPAFQLPSYVDDVIEGTYVSATSFKDASGTAITGESGKIYVDTTSGKTYRWSGSAFSVISETLALGETSSTAYRGDRGKVAYDHSQATGNPHGTSKSDLGLGNVENKSSATIRSELTKSNVTTALGYTPPTQDTTYGEATTSASGLMSASDKSKLNGIAEGANKYTHPTHTAKSSGFYKVTVDSSGHVSGTTAVTKSDITGLGIPSQDTTYSAMKGASSSAAGSAGLVPAPAAGKQASFLRGDGTWVVPTNTTYDVATQSANGLMSSTDKTKLDGIATGANKYTHPTHTAKSNGFYKVTVDSSGHVSGTTAVAKSDITALGIPAQDTTYSAATTSAAGLMSASDKSKLDGIATGANAYSLPTASSSTLGGVKIGSNISISSGKISVPAASDTTAGVTVVYPSAKCTTFSSDSGTVTPLAVQKGAKMFSITRPSSSTVNAITRYSNTTGDVKDSTILIEDVTNTRDTSQKAQVISVPAANGAKKMVYGYCTDQVDGTSFIGGLFDADATEFPYSSGLAIGGSSGNLLWKGTKVATTADNVASATKLQTARTISLTGDVTGSGSFDGSANLSITATIADDSHNHVIGNVDGLQTALDGLTTEMASVKKSASDGKTLVANAITGKGVTTATDATFATMATNIGSITTLSSGTSDATIAAGDVLSGKIGYGKNGAKITGSMTNQGAKTSSLNCGASYTIPAGYHNGSGKVTANSLSSQTSATATASDIASGKTAWVGGTKLTGTFSGVSINETLTDFKASSSISAGTYVSFVEGTKGTDVAIASNNYAGLSFSVAKLSDTKFFVAYRYGTNRYLYGVVCTINGTTITKGTATKLLTSTYCSNYISAVALDSSRVFIAHSKTNDNYIAGVVCSISGTTITAGTDVTINSTEYNYGLELHAKLLSNDKVIVTYGEPYGEYGSTSFTYVSICTISSTTITVASTKQFTAYGFSDLQVISSTSVLVFHDYVDSSNTTPYYNYGAGINASVLTISGTTVSIGTTYNLDTNRGSSANLVVGEIASGKYLVLHDDTYSSTVSDQHIQADIIKVSGSTISTILTGRLTDVSTFPNDECYSWSYPVLTRVSGNRFLLQVWRSGSSDNSYYSYVEMLVSDSGIRKLGDFVDPEMTVGTSQRLNTEMFLLSSGNVLNVFQNDSGSNADVCAMIITPGTVTSSYTKYLAGLAKTSVSSGSTVQVYTP